MTSFEREGEGVDGLVDVIGVQQKIQLAGSWFMMNHHTQL